MTVFEMRKDNWAKTAVAAQIGAVIATAFLVLLIYSQTQHMTRQTGAIIDQAEEMKKQTEESIAIRRLMAQQLEEVRLQTNAIIEMNRPVLVIRPTKDSDFRFEHGAWLMYLNIRNEGSRAAFQPLLKYRLESPIVSFSDSIALPQIEPEITKILALREEIPHSSFTLFLQLRYYRRGLVETSLESVQYTLERALTVDYSSVDTLWHAKEALPPTE